MRAFSFLLFFTLLWGGFGLTTATVQAQDPHFAQFYNAPLQVNPAMTGVHSGRFRVAINYREQWGSVLDDPFRTVGASFDMRHRIGRGDYMAWGMNALRDQAGGSPYVRNQGYLNAAYMKQLSGNRYRTSDQFLVGGLQIGAGQHTLDFSNLWFSNQFDFGTEQVNTALPNGEMTNASSGIYLDFNAGLLYYALFGDNASLYFGGAYHHLNGPEISFLDNSSQTLYRRWVGQIGGEIPLTRELSMLPAAIVMGQGPSLMTIFGLNFRYTNRDWREVAIRAGAWGQFTRRTDVEGGDFMFPSVIFSTILEMERFNIGISYDVNAGELSAPTNSRGAFELSFIYIHPASPRERVKCPKF
jgi:type IX secretion system PorP/SprF family membrane protein